MKRSPRAVRLTLGAVVLGAMALAAALAACSVAPPAEPPGIEGVVTDVTQGEGGALTILVEVPADLVGSSEASEFVSDKASVTLDDATTVLDSSGAATSRAALEKPSAIVRVWFKGPVAESYPVQGVAEAVQILGESSEQPVDQSPPPAGSGSELQLTESDAGSSRTIGVGDTLSVTLAANPTTGYTWALDGALPTTLEQVGDPAYTAESDALGAGGAETWTFRAVSAGESELKLKYWRSFEPDTAPERTFAVSLLVQ
ncbi:MAG: protease inhibitor I42 family protein [Coriobacteriia bacterium]|nr:protease inhibitor I42 family protein [Coriobacteriia bacterium]